MTTTVSLAASKSRAILARIDGFPRRTCRRRTRCFSAIVSLPWQATSGRGPEPAHDHGPSSLDMAKPSAGASDSLLRVNQFRAREVGDLAPAHVFEDMFFRLGISQGGWMCPVYPEVRSLDLCVPMGRSEDRRAVTTSESTPPLRIIDIITRKSCYFYALWFPEMHRQVTAVPAHRGPSGRSGAAQPQWPFRRSAAPRQVHPEPGAKGSGFHVRVHGKHGRCAPLHEALSVSEGLRV